MHWNPKGLAVCASLSFAFAAGCAHKNEPPPAPAPAPAAAPAPAPAPAKSSSKTKTKTAPAPAPAAAAAKGNAFAQIHEEMSDADVVKILGEPTGRREFPSPKAFTPFYGGPDTWRSEWSYKGRGRVLLYRNRYTGTWAVLEATADPSTP
jgi:hypothetical protein